MPNVHNVDKRKAFTKLINDTDVIFNLEVDNVCYHMYVKYL